MKNEKDINSINTSNVSEEPMSLLGNYILQKTIGEGTFGKVKLGYHILTNEKVAIKVLQKDKILEPEDMERVNREIRILKKLKNRNIIKIYEVLIKT